jgi:phage tail sheath protein FI
LDRISVRRLLLNLKKYVSSISKYLVFEKNTSVTREKFINKVVPYMNDVKSKQGLYTFKVVMDESNNTAEVIDRNQLVGQI